MFTLTHSIQAIQYTARLLTFLLLFIATQVQAEEAPVIIAFQYGPAPAKLAQAEGRYEQKSGRKITWKQFETGADIAIALTAGEVDLGLLGSTPLAAFTSRGLKARAFFIDSKTGESESFLVRAETIKSSNDLRGKTIAVPFVSTSHFALLAALKHFAITPQQVRIINLGPPEIIAAWQRGDIHAAYTWDPALSALKNNGATVLTHSAEVARWGSPTFNSWVVRDAFAEKNATFLQQFAEVSLEANRAYVEQGHLWSEDSAEISAIARISGSRPADVVALLQGDHYPDSKEQRDDFLQGTLAQVLKDTAHFLKEEKVINRVLEDYRPITDGQYLQALAASATSR